MVNIKKNIQMYILFIILSISTELITDNINKIIPNDKYPIILEEKNKQYFTIITSNGLYYVNKKTKAIEDSKNLNSNFQPPLFICIDESNNYFLFENKNYYKITLNSEFKITYLNYLKTLSIEFQYSGYIKANKFSNLLSTKRFRVSIDENEIIIYGKKESNIYFYFILANTYYSVEISSLGSNISCKLIKDVKYICAYSQGTYLMKTLEPTATERRRTPRRPSTGT